MASKVSLFHEAEVACSGQRPKEGSNPVDPVVMREDTTDSRRTE